MFDDLREAFREALDNFNKELKRDRVPETVDRLLVGMRDEIVDEKAQVSGLEAQLEQAQAQAKLELERGQTCRRREDMARRIADDDTADLAAQHAVKHEGHALLLRKKAEAIREELEFRRGTVDEMMAKFNEARGKRDELSATAGRASARESFSEADDLFSELDRMAAKIEGEHRKGEAAEILDSLDFDGGSDFDVELDMPPVGVDGKHVGVDGKHVGVDGKHVGVDGPPPAREEMDVDAALAELKRRMGEE